ncbi:MAG: hypothetical protein JWQ09_935 [Segetibacter sp.]|nr:hypothetical protein [Segetibacter sp.]
MFISRLLNGINSAWLKAKQYTIYRLDNTVKAFEQYSLFKYISPYR